MSIDLEISGPTGADPNGCLYIDGPTLADKPSPYWLSPNLIMTTTSDPGVVDAGAVNFTTLNLSWQGSETSPCALPQKDSQVVFDLFISNQGPSMSLDPGGAFLTTLVTGQLALNSTATNILASGDIASPNVFPFPTSPPPPGWDPANPPLGGTPVTPGHECLIARVYPNSLAESALQGYAVNAFPAGDLHYAQRNCTVEAAGGHMIKFQIGNGNVLREPELVAIQAVPDINPNPTVLAAVLPALQRIPAYKQIATTPLRSVGLDLSAFKSPHESLLEKILEWISKEVMEFIEDLEAKCKKAGGTSGRVVIAPGVFSKFDFTADLSGATPGDAYIYHLSQVNGQGQPYGGLTVGIVAT
jgi:hypothetical protein